MPVNPYEPPQEVEGEFEPQTPWAWDNYLAVIIIALALAVILVPFWMSCHRS